MARRKQTVTIKHVAADAGVSLQTVSRVINKEPNVRPAMRERVQASIEKLGYVPSIAAQRMSGSRSYLIMALNDRERTIADWRKREGTDWVDQMLLGGMLTCAEHGYRLIVELIDTHSDHIERELLGAIAALQPDGVILTPPHSQNQRVIELLHDHGISVARIGSLSGGPGLRFTMDDERAARLASEHLIGLGHRRIGFIAGSPEYELSAWRVDGWRSAMRAAGLSDAGLCEDSDFSFESGRRAALALLGAPDPVTAIIASNEQTALGVMAVAREQGVSIPDDLSLISFDDTPLVRFGTPALTAVAQPIAEVTARAVEAIIEDRKTKETLDRTAVVPAGLIERESTAPPRKR
ncbi:LacI family DNA-binding transcriptional regulator [Stakelama pacifica]|mgnify:CR=1 FL=1|uniref:LacI family transcriptional regulator n=1 Tax=Stakelama pacifica TaxID=517720 RepID=A0A4R6FIB1_9SPHN|nr:LacI family DNA-binding transcriptional regulator [Stakelama pacifica]MAX01175.1 LacI family transcriptional regulator [Sphingomonas sp.]TDN81116.1 LacI family transcriptional regulator [Stakelama pacifica]GGO96802.1 LacI family transcriptional regulator [Stakelama pacifica]